ncbi:hypothetical protein [Pseudescherichia sp.]|uniref:hypothetical protein n=1 Tax=Pseudescherichia sp. TaxID=2055881 RepID=UPI0028A04AF1|nr:hypothetical protein [Pseudescherichia sp.]
MMLRHRLFKMLRYRMVKEHGTLAMNSTAILDRGWPAPSLSGYYTAHNVQSSTLNTCTICIPNHYRDEVMVFSKEIWGAIYVMGSTLVMYRGFRALKREHNEYQQRVDSSWQKREREHEAAIERINKHYQALLSQYDCLQDPEYIKSYRLAYRLVRRQIRLEYRADDSRLASFFMRDFDKDFLVTYPPGTEIKEITKLFGGKSVLNKFHFESCWAKNISPF